MKKYILFWGDGDACTWHYYQPQPFVTDDIVKWEYDLLETIKNNGEKYPFIYQGIELPVHSTEFSYEIMTLEDWFNKNLPK